MNMPAERRELPQISVLLGSFNGEKYIEEQLKSLVQQTTRPKEIVICDDCSSDATIAIVQRWQTQYPNLIRFHINETNKGYQRNFLENTALCTGDYVAFCDQDDVWISEKLEKITKAIRENDWPEMVFSDCRITNATMTVEGQTGFEFVGLGTDEVARILRGELASVLIERPCITGMTMVCSIDLIRRCSRYQFVYDHPPHDYLVSLASATFGRYVVIREPLVYYRQHASNVIGMNAQKTTTKKRRPPITRASYAEAVLKDLHTKIELCLFVLSLYPSESDERTEQIRYLLKFCHKRLEARHSWSALMSLRTPENRALLRKQAFNKLFLKDLRTYLRLKTHALLNRLGMVH